MQDEVTVGLKLGDDEFALGFGRPVGDMVADRKVRQLGADAVGARAVRREQQPVNPPRGGLRAAVPSHLHQPGPDPIGRRVDRDGMRCHGHGFPEPTRPEAWLCQCLTAFAPS
jgi:hypothetical protein